MNQEPCLTKLPERNQNEEDRNIKRSALRAFVGEISPTISLRDWFAGQALVGVFTVDTRVVTPEDADRLANNCYILAEAMVRRSLQG